MLSEKELQLLDFLETGYITIDSVANCQDPMYYSKNPVKLTGQAGECYKASEGDIGVSLAPFKVVVPELFESLGYGCYSIRDLQDNKWYSYLLQENLSI